MAKGAYPRSARLPGRRPVPLRPCAKCRAGERADGQAYCRPCIAAAKRASYQRRKAKGA